jgi:hypothetical protein
MRPAIQLRLGFLALPNVGINPSPPIRTLQAMSCGPEISLIPNVCKQGDYLPRVFLNLLLQFNSETLDWARKTCQESGT